ncbi:hypothetical protein JXQ31_02285 [candidate division KSB1 bacterium]|nr:hypothetical protein [candidate division KSB1 bacterium]
MRKNKLQLNKHGLLIIISFLIFITFITGHTKSLKWQCSAVVYIENETVVAEDRYGNIINQEKAGKVDADIIQSAIDLAAPAGHLIITKGTYRLSKSLLVHSNIKITGEGRATIFVPPVDDFAVKIEKRDEYIFPRPYHSEAGNPMYGLIVRDITIDGARDNLPHSGKGLYCKVFWSSSFENIWIQNTGLGIHVDNTRESVFSKIYLINNGDEKKKEPGIRVDGNNNLHFRSLYIIYPNYIGMEIKSKLVFISQAMFHGWLEPHNKPAKYPLIQVKDLNDFKEGEGRFKSDVVIENSRITVGGEGSCAVNIINSPVTLRQCVATAGVGNTVVRVSDNARVNITDNSFYSFLPLPSGQYVLYAEDSEVIFKNNVVSCHNLQLCLKAARNSIIADNRFDAVSENSNIYIGDNNNQGSRCIQVTGNIFRQEKLENAVKVSTLSDKNIDIYNNQLWSE